MLAVFAEFERELLRAIEVRPVSQPPVNRANRMDDRPLHDCLPARSGLFIERASARAKSRGA